MTYVDFDPDLAVIGLIEPMFVDEQIGWYTEQVVIDEQVEAGWLLPVVEMGRNEPVGYLRYHREAIEPEPRYEKVLKWQWTEPAYEGLKVHEINSG